MVETKVHEVAKIVSASSKSDHAIVEAIFYDDVYQVVYDYVLEVLVEKVDVLRSNSKITEI